MSKHPHTTKFTYEDYLLFPDDGKRHEIIDGEHYMSPAPATRHQRIARRLLTAINNFLRLDRIGEVFIAPCDVVLSDLDVVQPDLLFVPASRSSIVTEKCIKGTPDLIIEIISETTRRTDEVIKRKLYERYCILEYRVVDPELESIKLYRLSEQGYVRTAEWSREAGDTITTPLLPGFKIPLAEVFE